MTADEKAIGRDLQVVDMLTRRKDRLGPEGTDFLQASPLTSNSAVWSVVLLDLMTDSISSDYIAQRIYISDPSHRPLSIYIAALLSFSFASLDPHHLLKCHHST